MEPKKVAMIVAASLLAGFVLGTAGISVAQAGRTRAAAIDSTRIEAQDASESAGPAESENEMPPSEEVSEAPPASPGEDMESPDPDGSESEIRDRVGEIRDRVGEIRDRFEAPEGEEARSPEQPPEMEIPPVQPPVMEAPPKMEIPPVQPPMRPPFEWGRGEGEGM